MNKKSFLLVLRIAALVLVLAAAAFFLASRTGLLEHMSYEASGPSSAKFELAKKWISPSAEVFVAMDAWKLFQDPGVSSDMMSFVGGDDTVAHALMNEMLSKKIPVGMIVVVANLGSSEIPASAAVIVQGDFDERQFVETALAALRRDGGSSVEDVMPGGRKAYLEKSDDADPFGFMFLDGTHVAIGTKASLSKLFADVPSSGMAAQAGEFVIYGRLVPGERIRSALPDGLRLISEVEMRSDDGQKVFATVSCKDLSEAMSLRMFLEGMRSFLILQNEANARLVKFIKGVSITGSDSSVVLSSDIASLMSRN